MKTLEKTTAALGLAAMLLVGACAHNKTVAITDTDYGRVDQTAGTTGNTNPVVIPGPAKVDSDGNVYTSSAAPGTGNASVIGTNTNVNLVPEKSTSTVAIVETPVATTIVEAPAPPAVVIETPAPPAAVIVETPAPPVVEVTTPMTSATTEEVTTQTTTRRRMSKD